MAVTNAADFNQLILVGTKFLKRKHKSRLDFLERAAKWCLENGILLHLSETGFTIENFGKGDMRCRFEYALHVRAGTYIETDIFNHAVYLPSYIDKISDTARAVAFEDALRILFSVPFKKGQALPVSAKPLQHLDTPCATGKDSEERAALLRLDVAAITTFTDLERWNRVHAKHISRLWKNERAWVARAVTEKSKQLKTATNRMVADIQAHGCK